MALTRSRLKKSASFCKQRPGRRNLVSHKLLTLTPELSGHCRVIESDLASFGFSDATVHKNFARGRMFWNDSIVR
jgi:hypothetical protein